jgi:hypothetical protein
METLSYFKNYRRRSWGKMWAENSNPDGKGATFSFSLPINDVKSAID